MRCSIFTVHTIYINEHSFRQCSVFGACGLKDSKSLGEVKTVPRKLGVSPHHWIRPAATRWSLQCRRCRWLLTLLLPLPQRPRYWSLGESPTFPSPTTPHPHLGTVWTQRLHRWSRPHPQAGTRLEAGCIPRPPLRRQMNRPNWRTTGSTYVNVVNILEQVLYVRT